MLDLSGSGAGSGLMRRSGLRPKAGAALPLDLTASTAFAAYSFGRKLRGAYAGKAFKAIETGGSTQSDIGFAGSKVDKAALAGFVGANSGKIVTVYDQAASLDLTQSTAANRPRVVSSGVMDTLNGYPAPFFDVAGNNNLIKSSVSAATATAWTFLMVVKRNVTPNATYHCPFAWGPLSGASSMGVLINGTRSQDWYEGDVCFYGNGYPSTNTPRVISRMGVMDAKDDAPVVYSGVVSASRVALRRNGKTMGTRVATAGAPGVTGTVGLSMGSSGGSGFYWPGQIAELIIFPSDIGDSAIAAIEANMMSFWNARPVRTSGIRGIDGQYVDFGQILQWEYTQAWSCLAAVKLGYPSTYGGGAQILFTTVGDGSPLYRGYECWFDASGRPRVRIMNDFVGNKRIDVYGNTGIVDGAEHVVLFTYDGSGTAAGVKIYVDGALQAMTTVNDTLAGNTIVNTKNFIVANQIDSNVSGYYLAGRLYAMELASTVRDATWAAAHATLANFPAPDANAELSLDFSTGSGTTVTDLSGHGRNGTLSSANMWLAAA